jgi:hypothetical protein
VSLQSIYHRQITTQALQNTFHPDALELIVRANLHQDRLAGQIGHPQFHFDDNAFAAGYAYMEAQRVQILDALTGRGDIDGARRAFGRLTHTCQDLYAHSNYVQLWREMHPGLTAATIDPLDEGILGDPRLLSGRIYHPWEDLCYIPFLTPLVKNLIPRDGHAWMNLDTPGQGEGFSFALQAALLRTHQETNLIIRRIRVEAGHQALDLFTGLSQPSPQTVS